jgi:hypothetical protein
MEKLTTAANLADPTPSRSSMMFAILLVLAAMVPLVIWPEDVTWGIDEPRLIANAWHANHDSHLAAHGLYGNFGVCYGPVPTQIYQLLLCFTHDPYTLVILRALLCATVTAASLLWLARSLNLPPWFAAAILIAPQITNHHRVLWDASFTIPIGSLALAAFASFIRTRGKWPLRVAVVAALELPLIHPQSLPLSLPILGYLLWKHRADLREDRRGLLWSVAFLLVFNAKYIFIATFNVIYRFTHGTGATYPGTGSRLDSVLAPLLGGHLLNGYDYVVKMARPPGPDWLVTTASWGARLVYLFAWLGMASALTRIPRALRAWKSEDRSAASSLDLVAVVALGGLFLQALIFVALRIPLGPQYYFGTFALHVFFAWMGVNLLRRTRLSVAAGGFYAASCAFITLGVAHQLHYHGYDYVGWPTVRTATELTRALNAYEDTAAYTDIEFLDKYPQPLRTIRLLLPPTPGETQRKSGGLLIRYVERDGKQLGLMTVTDLAGNPPPKDSKSINITPLPRDWVPDPKTW